VVVADVLVEVQDVVDTRLDVVLEVVELDFTELVDDLVELVVVEEELVIIADEAGDELMELETMVEDVEELEAEDFTENAS
jgi:hypothetical protein